MSKSAATPLKPSRELGYAVVLLYAAFHACLRSDWFFACMMSAAFIVAGVNTALQAAQPKPAPPETGTARQ